MKSKDILLGIVEAILWFWFLYVAVFAMQHSVNVAKTALLLLMLGYAAAVACPLIRHSDSWKRTWGK